MPKKKPEPNPIENAIGDRTKPKTAKEILRGYPVPEQTPDEPSPQEMLTLEELNRQTEERLQDQYPEEETPQMVIEKGKPVDIKITPTTPVSKPDPQPVTKPCSPGSPPQKIEKKIPYDYDPPYQEGDNSPALGTPEDQDNEAQRQDSAPVEMKELTVAAAQEQAKLLKADFIKTLKEIPAEDVEFTNLKKYILEDGFVLATVAFHIVSLCAEPLMTPSTTMWDFVDRASIPDMVLALLNQPGYLEGIWPSLKIVMGSNVGNSAWSAGIATTLAFFDVIRTLPALKELRNESRPE